MIYVFDSSFIGALIIPDETNALVGKMYSKIENDDLRFTPYLVWHEITNMFMNLIRRKRFTFESVMEFYPLLEAFHLICDDATGVEYSKKLLRLCGDYKLSSYDAAYLELAERKKATLCTMDERLREVAKKCGVTVIK